MFEKIKNIQNKASLSNTTQTLFTATGGAIGTAAGYLVAPGYVATGVRNAADVILPYAISNPVVQNMTREYLGYKFYELTTYYGPMAGGAAGTAITGAILLAGKYGYHLYSNNAYQDAVHQAYIENIQESTDAELDFDVLTVDNDYCNYSESEDELAEAAAEKSDDDDYELVMAPPAP